MGPGEAVKISLHPREVIDRFRSGQLPELDHVNPETLRGLDAENASGGARPNADLAFQVAADRLISTLRQGLVELLKNRQNLMSSQDYGIRVFLIAGTFGGTGSGSFDRIKQWLLRLGNELGVHLDVYPFLLLPGAHAPKDPATSYANTFALLKELAADSTGNFWRLEAHSSVPQRSGFRAPFLLSDLNNAPGGPRVLSDVAFTGLVGDLIYELVTTALGAHLDAQIGDYGVAGTGTTLMGEPRQARSIGLSTIFLDLDRQELWSRSVLALKFIAAASQPVAEGVIRADVRAFLEGNALVFSDGRNDLAGHLLNECASHEHLSVTRLRSLFALATQDLTDSSVLAEGRNCLNLALQQCGDFEPALNRYTGEVMRRTGQLVKGELRRLITDYRRGPASASLWLSVIGGVTDAMLAAAGNALGQLQTDINELDMKIRQTEAEYLEDFKARGLFYRALNRGVLSRSAAAFRADLEAWAVLRVRSQAVAAAIQVLNRLRQAVQDEINATGLPLMTSLSACSEMVREDQRRAAAHSLEFGCPNGLPLLRSESDLADLHSRCFPESDEVQIQNDFYAQLSAQDDPVAVLKDAEALAGFIRRAAPRTLIGAKLEELNVVDEIRHRYPEPSALGSVFRERDIEAYERLPLAATSDQTSGLTLVRLMGIDGARLGAVRDVLDHNQTDRTVRYLPVAVGDRQRVTFLQVRAVFPLSDWRGYPIARAYYDAAHASSLAETQHVFPGNRFLPSPGKRVAGSEFAQLLVRAWVLGRLSWSENPGWSVLPAVDGDTTITIARDLPLDPHVVYGLAVDLVSSTSCFIRLAGLETFRERLRDLEETLGRGAPAAGLESFESSIGVGRALRELYREAEWWERNTSRPLNLAAGALK